MDGVAQVVLLVQQYKDVNGGTFESIRGDVSVWFVKCANDGKMWLVCK